MPVATAHTEPAPTSRPNGGPPSVATFPSTRPVAESIRETEPLTLLLLRANDVVSTDRLVEELWGDELPGNAAKSVQIHVSRLRKVLGNGVLETARHGYLLRVGPGELDVDRFRDLVEAGKEALTAGDSRRASELLREALSVWRGPALADFAFASFAQGEIARVEELRLAAVEARLDADLALGRHAEVVSELEGLAAGHPLRESLTGRLMLALYRSGRQAEALRVYQESRRRLSDELGLEPSEPVKELERAILNHDPALAPPARPRPPLVPLRLHRRAGTLVLAGALVLAAAAVAVVLATRGGRSATLPVAVGPDSVVAIGPATNRVLADVPVSNGPTLISGGAGALWVVNGQDETVSRIDPKSRAVAKTIGVPFAPDSLVADESGVWLATGGASERRNAVFVRIEPQSSRPGAVMRTGGGGRSVLALGGGSLWIANDDDPRIYRLDPGSNAVSLVVADVTPRSLVFGAGSLWALRPVDQSVARIDPGSHLVAATIPFKTHSPGAMTFGAGALWVADALEDVVWRIDPVANLASGTIHVGKHPTAVAVADGFVWVGNAGDSTVSKVDPRTNEVVATIRVGYVPVGIAGGGGAIWVLVRKCVVAC